MRQSPSGFISSQWINQKSVRCFGSGNAHQALYLDADIFGVPAEMLRFTGNGWTVEATPVNALHVSLKRMVSLNCGIHHRQLPYDVEVAFCFSLWPDTTERNHERGGRL